LAFYSSEANKAQICIANYRLIRWIGLSLAISVTYLIRVVYLTKSTYPGSL
jgi:hypothetical protein